MLPRDDRSYQKWVHFLIYYTLLVVLWGAWVRISHSGDGCGDTWPLCQGQIVPEARHGKTLVELSHRLTSGLFGIYVIFLFFRSRKIFAINHPARKWAKLTLIFTITEALLGAKLVLFGLVGTDSSFFRMFAMVLHLFNSLTLVACIVILHLVADKYAHHIEFAKNGLTQKITRWLTISFLLLAGTGAIAALSTTLFPSNSLMEGLQSDFSSDSHWILKWRLLHPIFGLLLGGGLVLALWLFLQSLENPAKLFKMKTQRLFALLGFNVGFGLMTLLNLSPIWMKLGHLTLGYLTWIAMIHWLVALADVKFELKS